MPVLATGTGLYRDSTNGVVSGATEIASVTTLSVNPTRDSLETTALDSTNRIKTFARGMIDAGEVTIEGFYAGDGDTSHAAVFDDLFASDDTLVEWAIVFADDAATTIYGDAFITSGGIDAPVSELMTFSATLKWAGAVTISST